MNSVYLMGGLGNQLFQIFSLIAYCLKYNKQFQFLYSKTLTTGVIRVTYWDNFLINLKPYTTHNKSIYNNKQYKELTFKFLEIKKQNEPILLYGYFQSYKYFEKYYQKIISIIGLHNIQIKLFNKIKNFFFLDDSILISLHFRLGDYKEKQDYHPVMKVEYYIKSLIYILSKVNKNKLVKVLYFCEKEDNYISDKNIISIQNQLTNKIDFIKVPDTIDDWEQMIIMSLCDHNIIANSTFSWWGAYMNRNKYKIVCYPEQWFGKLISHNTDDLFPEDWIKVST